jgi:hypothetical protein
MEMVDKSFELLDSKGNIILGELSSNINVTSVIGGMSFGGGPR